MMQSNNIVVYVHKMYEDNLVYGYGKEVFINFHYAFWCDMLL